MSSGSTTKDGEVIHPPSVLEMSVTIDLMVAACKCVTPRFSPSSFDRRDIIVVIVVVVLGRLGRALVRLGKKPEDPGATTKNSVSVINPGVSNLSPTNKTDIANRFVKCSQYYCIQIVCLVFPLITFIFPTCHYF